jgi:hypothetical protein
MSRIFSIDFGYKGEIYTAVVTITKANADSPISVYVPDTELHHILPDGKLTLMSPQELQNGHYKKTPIHELLNSIQIAIESHEGNKPSVGLW